MNYAPLDPSQTVVLFADLQAGIIELSATNEVTRLRRAVSALAKLAADGRCSVTADDTGGHSDDVNTVDFRATCWRLYSGKRESGGRHPV